MKARVTLDNGTILDFEPEENPLGIRWWSWTDYRWRPYQLPPPRAEGEATQLYSSIMWCQDSAGRFRVLPLGYYDDGEGRNLLLIAIPGGRFRMVSPHTIFPIMDDAEATEGAEQFRSEVMAMIAVQPTLF